LQAGDISRRIKVKGQLPSPFFMLSKSESQQYGKPACWQTGMGDFSLNWLSIQ